MNRAVLNKQAQVTNADLEGSNNVFGYRKSMQHTEV